MTPTELIADNLRRNLELLKMTLADFSDADMMVRPCAGANHALWQLGHLVGGEVSLLNACKPGAAELPAGLAEKFNAKTASLDDASAFLPKATLLDLLGKARATTVQWVSTLKPEDLDRPGAECLQTVAPTVGHVLTLMISHVSMHVGQMQVIRRKLGKPILF
ncbi:MAG TPA: DinB family protein [Tepidisphaeraceae bacterium]|nr:DinB family protein [Tepidisphaeraceae bacterium]